MTATQYFAFLEGQVAGPFDTDHLRTLGLAPDTQICRAGSEEWITLAQEPTLLAPLDMKAARPTPFVDDGGIPLTERKKIFIIHGKGNTMDNAFGLLIDLMRVKFRYFRANFYVDERNSNFARYIIYDHHMNPYLKLVDRALIGKLVIAPNFPSPPDWSPDQSWTKLSEFKISDKLGLYGAPTLALQKKRWTDNHFQAIWIEFGRLLGMPIANQPALTQTLMDLRGKLRPPDGGLYIEHEYKEAIRRIFPAAGADPEPFIAMLLELQRLGDAGGDLDTIASNALYGAWVLQAWEEKYGTPPRYGRDFEFDFVNYHQSFLHLARHQNSEIYLPDFPMEAIPDLAESAEALESVGSRYVRIDDHHPLGQERIDLLNSLKERGHLDNWVMSGPLKGGAEQSAEERTCGADLVHAVALKGTHYDSPGLEELRRLAHQQDLHFIEDPDDRLHPDYLAIDLSKLIGSKHSRIDMAQQLMHVRTYDDIRNIMHTTGWREIVDRYEQGLEDTLPKLEAAMAMIEFVMPGELADVKLPPKWLVQLIKILTAGSLDLDVLAIKKHPEKVHRIFMTLAPFQSRKEHRINVASAIGYLKRFHRFDYFFFAWGASLLTTRRYNDKDQALDLSTLMQVIGGPGDGGHSSAATCKPPSNAAWPAEKFKKLNKNNFLEYAQYISSRVADGTSAKVFNVRAITEADRDFTE